MFHSKILPATMAAVITLGATTGIAYAGNRERSGETENAQELAAVLNAKTSLAQAIAAAEQETGGKAIDTGLENQDGNMTFEVEVAEGNTVKKVLVDLQTGKVVKIMAADTEHGENGHRDED